MTDDKETIGQLADSRFSEMAIDEMRGAIKEAGDREVFFAGELDDKGKVTSVRVCARGHESGVNAPVEGLRTREVVIHNHPSGLIAPSEEDLALASIYHERGHGVYIVDNAIARVYVVIEPAESKEKPLAGKDIHAWFNTGGHLAKHLNPYEARPQQLKLAEEVSKAFNQRHIAVVEAPTGVGKTMAYLVPAVLWALDNGERVVVSTRTINLQEQIIHKDLPLLQRCTPRAFKAILFKGRGNYLCWSKMNRALSEAVLFEDEGEEVGLKAIAAWAEKTADGSLSDMGFVPGRELWSKVSAEGDTCRFQACPDSRRCFVSRARREAARADIIVVNHHILFSDLAVKREKGEFSETGVLPGFRRLILDEAHNTEDCATEFLGVEASRRAAAYTFGHFMRLERRHERGLFPMLRTALHRESCRLPMASVDAIQAVINDEAIIAMGVAREAVLSAFDAIRAFVASKAGQVGGDIKLRITPAILDTPDYIELSTVYVREAAGMTAAFLRVCSKLRKMLSELDHRDLETDAIVFQGEIIELTSYPGRLETLLSNLVAATDPAPQPDAVRWLEIDGANPHIVRAVKCPLDVGATLAEWLYPNLYTLCMTSATLSVQKGFGFFYGRVGLNRVRKDRIASIALPTVFDFQKQALLGVPMDMPDPTDARFLDACVNAVGEILRVTGGHAFVLFTSFYAMDFVHGRLEEALRSQRITSLKQGQAARTKLLDRFRDDTASVLFATDSFWEGVDVAGDALQCVILPKLPFRVPTEPILEARVEAIEAAGGNAFMEYTVPQAVIKFRQGFGRLIRRTSDRGSVVVLDRRIATKHYGRVFLDSLPPMNVARGPFTEVLSALESFHSRNRSEET